MSSEAIIDRLQSNNNMVLNYAPLGNGDFDHLKQIKIMKISVHSAEERYCYTPLKFGRIFQNSLTNKIMRICVVSILVLTTSLQLLSANPVKSQSIDQTKVKMELKNGSLMDAIKKIEAQTTYRFIYSNKDVRAVKNLNYVSSEQSIANVLKTLLSNTSLGFKQIDNKISITAMPVAESLAIAKDLGSVAIDKTITGNVTDDAGLPLIGVSVAIKGTSTGVTTNEKGDYRISVPDNVNTLVFSYIGFVQQEVDIVGKSTVNVKLSTDSKSLNEVVVVGYGTQRRGNVTGAISSVNSKQLNELPVVSVTQALQGRVAGLNVVNNGSPGSEPVITIRGVSSVSQSSTPLYVVDGFPTGSINNFDPRDIESVEVLKDASAAAIYGSRGTNGVILITTKKATGTSRPIVSFDSYIGVQSAWKKLDLLNTAGYLQYERALNGNAGIGVPPRLQPANFNLPIYAGATQTFAQTNTDWQDEYFRNAMIQNHNISIAGGGPSNHYYTSAGYFNQDGIAVNTNFNRISFRINSDYKISNAITFGENATVSQTIQKGDAGGNRSPLANVIRMQPYLPVYNPHTQGGFFGPLNSFDGSDPTNPVEGNLITDRFNNNLKILANAYLNIKVTPWLTFRTSYGIDYTNSRGFTYTPIYNDGGTSFTAVASINNNRNITTVGLATHQLTFDKTFDKHHVNLVAVYEQQNFNTIAESGAGNQANNTVRTLTGATNVSVGYSWQENVLQSMVSRLSYDYDGKYLLNASIRKDGSSVWAPGKKYQVFPAASIGWKVDREKFMSAFPAISELKLRAGYGVTGLNPSGVGNYGYVLNVTANGGSFPFGNTNTQGNTSYFAGTANPNLLWETTKQTDAGFDLGLWQNKLTLSVDFYVRRTDNLMVSVPTPYSMGFGGAGVNQNIGSMKNEGFDIQASYSKREGDFKWTLSGVFGVARNNVVKLQTPTASIQQGGDGDFTASAPITNTVQGRSMQPFFGFIADGIFQSTAEVAAHATQANAAPGDIRFKDVNGDGVINDGDRTFIGSYLPDFTYSLNYTASYKGFDASIFFQGVQGNEIFNGTRVLTEGMNRLFNAGTQVLNAWTPTNTNTDIPRAIAQNPALNARMSTRFIEDGSYLRLKNVIIGYTLPASALNALKKINVSKLRVYVSSQNLLTFTKYKGFDPEISGRGNTFTNGIDFGQFPSSRSFQVGLQASF